MRVVFLLGMQGQRFCIECIVTALLIHGDARRIESIPIILAKNSARSRLMVFLSQKHGVSGRLLGLLTILQSIKPSREIDETMKLLETPEIKQIQATEKNIIQKMMLYNAA
jgi:hypothetical protein